MSFGNVVKPDWTRNRAGVLLLVFVLSSVIVLIRLFDRSVRQSGLAEAKSEAQGQVAIKLNPFRGKILVHGDGGENVSLALNEPRIRVDVIPRNLKNPEAAAKKLAPLLAIPEKELFDKINNDKPYIPPVKRNLSIDVGLKIDDLHLAGVLTSTEAFRTYPEGKMAASVLGFVNGEGNGQYGIEGFYDSQLQGFAASVVGERDGWGNTYIDQTKSTNNKGADVVLTIDRDVQAVVERDLQESIDKFKAKSGSVVIIEPQTGKVIAMAALPSFDPNHYNEVKSEDQGVFHNRVIGVPFEPGSVMKTIAIAAALDAKKISMDDIGTYGASVKVDNYEIHTAQNKAFGRETLTDVLVNSDNVAMVDISGKLGRELEYDYMGRFSFAKKVGIDLDTESAGFMPQLKDWRAVNTATISFGQGITVTPLQMVLSYAAIANKGVLAQPIMVDEIIYPDGHKESVTPKAGKQVIGETAAADVAGMLREVVSRGHGKRAGVAGYEVVGKTGTAQIADPNGRGYLEGTNNGSFAGFAPMKDPKFAMFVTLEEPQGVEFAESSAAPLWGEIAEYLLKTHYHLPAQK